MMHCPGGTVNITQIREGNDILCVEFSIYSSAINTASNVCVTDFVEFVSFACAKECTLVTRRGRSLDRSRKMLICKPCVIGGG